MSRVCFVVGARPNFMKAAPVVRALAARSSARRRCSCTRASTTTPRCRTSSSRELGLPRARRLPRRRLRHPRRADREGARSASSSVLIERRPDLVVVAGRRQLDARRRRSPRSSSTSRSPTSRPGLRSFDRSMPEEHNRALTDHVSALLLVHSESGDRQPRSARGSTDGVHLVGNTMIDSLLAHVDRPARARAVAGARPRARATYGLVTLHRPALVDDPELLRATVEALDRARRRAARSSSPSIRARCERIEAPGLDRRRSTPA